MGNPITEQATEIERAYGLLWRYMGPSGTVQTARRILLSLIDKDGQRRAIQWCKENTPPVSESEVLAIDGDFTQPAQAEPSAKDALQAIADISRGEAIMHGTEAAYRAVEALFDTPPEIHVTKQPSVAEAARVLLGNDFALSKMAEAMHDGPLMADDYAYSAATPAGGWCLDMARAALRILTQEAE